MIIRSLLSIFILIILQLEQCQSLEEKPSKTSEYKVLKINKSIEMVQNSMAITYKLDLEPKITQIQKYFIIDINLIGIQQKQSKLTVCLNYDNDLLKDQRYIEKGQYNCSFTDNTTRIQQKSQYLIIIDTNDQSFQSQRAAYLTIFYEGALLQNNSTEQQLINQFSFFVFMYFTNKMQCHSNCNGKNGVCDESTGRCICNKNYFDSDCNIETKELNFNQTNDLVNILIQPQKYSIYKMNVTHLVQSSDDKDISINFKKFSGDSLIYFQVLINKEQFPSFENHDLSLKMDLEEIKLSNIKQICNNFKINQQMPNIPQQQSNSSIDHNCFIFISIYQSQSYQSIPLRISLQQEDNNQININPNNYKNQNQNSTVTQTKQEFSETKQNHKTVIIVTIVCSFTFITIGVFLCLKYKKPKLSLPLTQSIVANQNIDSVVQSIPLNHLNKEEQHEQRMKFIVQKRRFLQEKLMSVIVFNQALSKSIQDFNNMEKQNQFLQNHKIDHCNNDQLKSEKNQNDNKIQIIQQIQQKNCPSKNFDCNNQILNENISNDLEKQQPKQTIEQSSKINQNQQCCAICLIEFLDEEKVRKTICNHIFHTGCFSDWLDKSQNCPLCRQSFEIIDMIDYQTQQLCKQKNEVNEKMEVINERNKVEKRIEDLNNDFFQLSQEEFANIFSYFISDSKQKDIQNSPVKSNEDEQNNNFTLTSPVFSPLMQSTFCDENSSNRLFLDSSNDSYFYKFGLNLNKRPIKRMSYEQQIIQKAEIQNTNIQLNNYDNLNNDEIIEPESNLNKSEICCSQETMYNDQNLKSQSLKNIDTQNDQNQVSINNHIKNKILTRIKRRGEHISQEKL